MTLTSPGAILFHYGLITIRWYGVMIALGFLTALKVAQFLGKKQKLNNEELVNTIFISFLGGIIGARLYYVAISLSYFTKHLNEILAIWQGGMSIHGGVIGGIIFGGYYCYRKKQPFLQFLDITGVVLPLGQAIGRWGNFFNQEAFGTPVNDTYPLKLFIEPAKRPLSYFASSYFRPTFLYESIWDLLIFLVLMLFFYKLKLKAGSIFFIYLILYSYGRLLVEPIRTDSITYNDFPVPIIACYVSIFISLTMLFLMNRKLFLKK